MDDAPEQRFEGIELRLTAAEERIIAHDESLNSIRKLLEYGMRMLVQIEKKVDGLTDSHARLYGSLQELAEAQKRTEQAQQRTEDALRRFIERSGNGHRA